MNDPTKMVRQAYTLRLLNEKARFNYIWNQFKSMIKNEMDDEQCVKTKYGRENIRTWKDFEDRKKIIHTLLWLFTRKQWRELKQYG
jgi:hypothetical protein